MDGMTPFRQLEESLNSASAARTAAQRSNLLPVTAAGYMSWRERSLTLLTGSAFPLSRETQLFLRLCRPAAGQAWLDVGTSGGYYAGLLAGAGAHVIACDLSPAMLRVAQRRESSPLIEWALLNGEATGLPDASLDGVTVGATLNETHDPRALLREAARLLRPGGQLWVMYLARNGGPWQELLSRLGGLTFLDPAQVREVLPGLERTDLLRMRDVVFERHVRSR